GSEVTLTIRFVSGSTLRSIWQPTPQKVHVVFVLVSCTSWSAGAPSTNFSYSAPVGQTERHPPQSSHSVSSHPRPQVGTTPASGPRPSSESAEHCITSCV